MFGKPVWFIKKSSGKGLQPICWQGWTYTAVWAAVLILPFLLLIGDRLAIEALVWLTVATAALVWDVRQVLNDMNVTVEEDVLFIDENETLSEQFATRNYDFRLRD